MLNELYHLAMALEGSRILPYEWHKELKPLPNAGLKKPCYKILIGPDGSISGIEPMENKLVSSLRKWQLGGNGYSFPGFNILPLYCVADIEQRKLLEQWTKRKAPIDKRQLQEWCIEENEIEWNEPMLNECLGKIPHELKNRCGQIPDAFIALKNLFERTEYTWDSDGCVKFIKALKNYLLARIESDENQLYLLPILISPKPENISIFLDVPDWDEYPVAHKRTIEYINKQLLSATNSGIAIPTSKTEDAFGLDSVGHEDKLPEVKLPVIGGVKLRAMNSESPCQYRYGTVDAKSFRVGASSRTRTKAALEWLKDECREGETWGRADSKELIFAYPEILSETPPKLVSCFGAGKTDDSEARFENYAKEVMDCLRGLTPSLRDVKLHVFSLRKMDKARTKVVFHRNYSAERLADAAEEWQKGCANIPMIRIRSWSEEKGKIIFSRPDTPFPLEISDCLNRVWKMDGTTRDKVNSIPKSRGIELLLDESAATRQTPHLLAAALLNGKGLFLSLGNSMHRDGPNDVLKLDGLKRQKQLMPAVLGLLLWKLGIEKESYMKDSSYLVGRMLKFADELHVLYCKEVRKGSLPSQLLGNALMSAALDSPTQALAQLALRIAPYIGWARTNSTGSARLSRYFLKEFGLVEGKLRDLVLPTRLNDAARAQLLLGYISASSEAEDITDNQKGEHHG